MDLSKLAQKATEMIDQRGGMEALREDVGELEKIAESPGSVTDKLKAAAQALKTPGDPSKHQPVPGSTGHAPSAPGATGSPAPVPTHPDPNVEDKQDPQNNPSA